MFKKSITGLIVLILLIGVVLFLVPKQTNAPVTQIHPSPTAAQTQTTFTYKGVAGKDALGLLQNMTKVELDKTGMVASINGRSVDSKKKEYWAFYVNGKYASVGPKDYITKENDTILWKIENY